MATGDPCVAHVRATRSTDGARVARPVRAVDPIWISVYLGCRHTPEAGGSPDETLHPTSPRTPGTGVSWY
jgi:hypothetical protein